MFAVGSCRQHSAGGENSILLHVALSLILNKHYFKVLFPHLLKQNLRCFLFEHFYALKMKGYFRTFSPKEYLRYDFPRTQKIRVLAPNTRWAQRVT